MKIGIIGGSGLEKGDILQNLQEVEVQTPYGVVKLKKDKGLMDIAPTVLDMLKIKKPIEMKGESIIEK